MSKPSAMMSFDFSPLIFATKPTPHESCSLRGSYRPCFSGALNTSDPHSLFIGRDRGRECERQCNLIDSGEQTFAPKRVHGKGEKVTGGRSDGHFREVDSNRVISCGVNERVSRFTAELDGGDPVLEGIAGEDVRKARRDYRANAHVGERPGGMLAARSASEIV